MGVWATGPRSRSVSLAAVNFRREAGKTPAGPGDEDIGGSPYAIAGYSVPETLGGESALQAFRQRLHRRGMRLILDFIPNHVGLDHRWLHERSELFVQSPREVSGTFAQKTRAGIRWLATAKIPIFRPGPTRHSSIIAGPPPVSRCWRVCWPWLRGATGCGATWRCWC